MKRLLSTILSVAVISILLYGILAIRPYQVSGDSMTPALHEKNIVMVDRFSHRIWPLVRGEIIVYRDASLQTKIKRVIGLPRETIHIKEGNVFVVVGGEPQNIEERYLWEHVRTCVPGACTKLKVVTYEVPEASYFVLGDNQRIPKIHADVIQLQLAIP